MSGQAMINVVDDEEMSSQGSVNVPVALQPPLVQQGPTAMEPTEVVGTPFWMAPNDDAVVGGSGTERQSGSHCPSAVYAGGSWPHYAG